VWPLIVADYNREFWQRAVDWLRAELSRAESPGATPGAESTAGSPPPRVEASGSVVRRSIIPGFSNRVVITLLEETLPAKGTASVEPVLRRFIERPRLWRRIMSAPDASLLPMALVHHRREMDPELLFRLMYELLGAVPRDRRYRFLNAMEYLCIHTARE